MSVTIEPLPIEKLPHAKNWAATLQDVARQPLAFRPDFPQVAQRYEAWWRHESLGRPIVIARHDTHPARAITRRSDMLDDPQAWLDAKLGDVGQLQLIGDALPVVRVDFGPVLLGGLLGGKMEFTPHTSWTHPHINDDWSNAPDGVIDPDNPLWKQFEQLLDVAASHAAGQYLVGTPDLGGSADVLLNLRGPSGLCMDALEQPRLVCDVIDRIYPAWHQAMTLLYDTVVARHQVGLVHWLELWSDVPYMIPACDFNYMISPEIFERVCLADIARQAATVKRAVFHLDGPGAARHIDALLQVPDIQAIQFTPGEGTPSIQPWISMFKKIQAKGRSLLIITPEDEVLELAKALKPQGLAILVWNSKNPQPMFKALCHQCGVQG